MVYTDTIYIQAMHKESAILLMKINNEQFVAVATDFRAVILVQLVT